MTDAESLQTAGDYHNNMSFIMYMLWIVEKLVPTLDNKQIAYKQKNCWSNASHHISMIKNVESWALCELYKEGSAGLAVEHDGKCIDHPMSVEQESNKGMAMSEYSWVDLDSLIIFQQSWSF